MMTIEEAIAKNLSTAPPLNPEQVKLLTGLLSLRSASAPKYVAPKPVPETPAERDTRLGAELTRNLSVCSMCGIEEKGHGYAKYFGHISHHHVSLTLAERQRVLTKLIKKTNSSLRRREANAKVESSAPLT